MSDCASGCDYVTRANDAAMESDAATAGDEVIASARSHDGRASGCGTCDVASRDDAWRPALIMIASVHSCPHDAGSALAS